jgi:hypothetical protein
MLRGRCFRLDTLYQTDPDYQGRLYVGMNQLPSPLIEKKKVQVVKERSIFLLFLAPNNRLFG